MQLIFAYTFFCIFLTPTIEIHFRDLAIFVRFFCAGQNLSRFSYLTAHRMLYAVESPGYVDGGAWLIYMNRPSKYLI